ncbi:hypothetical protein Lal_00042687 [Lupinus albus]|nr:hypothetical protein Lal_00042687 [Lupinus albus]
MRIRSLSLLAAIEDTRSSKPKRRRSSIQSGPPCARNGVILFAAEKSSEIILMSLPPSSEIKNQQALRLLTSFVFSLPSSSHFLRLLTLFFPKSSITKIKRKWITLRFAAERSFENGRGSETDPSEMKTGVIPAERTHDSLPFGLRTSPSSSHFLRLLTSLLKYKVCMLPHTLPQHTRVTHTYALYPVFDQRKDFDIVDMATGSEVVGFKGAPSFKKESELSTGTTTLRFFEFPNLDASPTIEEYEVLLDIGKSGRLKVYQFTDHQNVTETIYGVVLFPFVYDIVDQAAIDVFTKFKKFLVNLVPAVLAETLLSFQTCHERGVHKIREIAINPMQLSDWKKIFVEITPRNLGQNVAYMIGIQKSSKMGDDARSFGTTARVYGLKELGEHQSYYTPEYKEWRKDRMKSTTIPPPTLPQEPPKQSEKELLQANQIRLLEAKLEEARNEIEKYGFSIEKLDKIIETQKKEHTSLKRDYASMCSTSEKYHLIRTGKEKDKKIAELIRMNEEKMSKYPT